MSVTLYLLVFLAGVLFLFLVAFVLALRAYWLYKRNFDPIKTFNPKSILSTLIAHEEREKSTWT
tara:strand:- start:605 stop:796 length:192 start_codon:yes stop_codon:yes gene_type:complete